MKMEDTHINFEITSLDQTIEKFELRIKNSVDLIPKDKVPVYLTVKDSIPIKAKFHTADSNYFIDKEFAESRKWEELKDEEGKPVIVQGSFPGNVTDSKGKVFIIKILTGDGDKAVNAYSFPRLLEMFKIELLIPKSL